MANDSYIRCTVTTNTVANVWRVTYCQTANISRIKPLNLNVSCLVWQLSLPNPLKLDVRAGVKYVFVFANTNTNTAYLYLYLIKFQTMYLYLYLIQRIWCIWQIRFQIHFFPGPFSKHKFMEHKLTRIFFIKMLKSAIPFQNKCRGLILLIPIGGCVCALDLACQWVCDKSFA